MLLVFRSGEFDKLNTNASFYLKKIIPILEIGKVRTVDR
jgi:hypothetical protein